MRWLAAPLVLIVLSGCVQSQSSIDAPDDCIIFCGGDQETTVHFDWVPPVLGILFVVLLIGIIVAAAARGRDNGQQQQQQVVIHLDSDGDVRQK